MLATARVIPLHAALDLRRDFPAPRANPDIVYFDNASTAQMPEAVISAVRTWYETAAANPGRAAHDWAMAAEETMEQTRRAVADYIGAPDADGIAFTSGTTMGLNMIAQSWGRSVLCSGDEILLCLSDHHSMTLPWKSLAKEKGLTIRPYPLRADGRVDPGDLADMVNDRTRLCCVTHINNTAGYINDLKALRAALPDHVFLAVDAAQSISHVPPHVTADSIDFLAFSGHKMFAQTGIGALYVSPRARNGMLPLLAGGGMAEHRPGDPFYKKMEAGSPNMAGIISLKAALNFIASGGSNHAKKLKTLTHTLYRRLLSNPRIDLLYEQKPYALDGLASIASFTVEEQDSGEIGDILATHGIYVRTGRHCAGALDSVRISLQIYNTEEEILKVCDILDGLSKGRL